MKQPLAKLRTPPKKGQTVAFSRAEHPLDISIAESLDRQLFGNKEDRDFSQDQVWIGLTPNLEPVAYCSIRMMEDGIAFLSRAGVIEEYRGRGLQKRMIRLRLKAARANGYQLVVTYTAPNNYASINSLISCGFKIYEPEYKWAGKWPLYWQYKI